MSDFFVETLANLAKPQTNRTADEAVRIIADKTPELSGGPCVFHHELAVANLLGQDIPMDGRVFRPGGRYVRGGGRTGVVYNESPEMKAFGRWQAEEFFEVERLFAAGWRRTLEEADLNIIAKDLRNRAVDAKSCTSDEKAKEIAQGIVDGSTNPYTRLALAVQFLNVPQKYHLQIMKRWEDLGQPELSAFAPYTAFVLTIEMYFHISIAANLISAERHSNRTDIAYLFYLPFCMMFVSNDNLHYRTARLFLRSDQEFVQGSELKADLKRLNTHYLELPEDERDQGVMRIATHPPIEGEFLTTSLWRKFMSETVFSERDHADATDSEQSRKVVEQLNAFTQGETLRASQIPKTAEAVEAMGIQRRVHRRKGSWYLVPKNLPDPTDG